MLNSHIDLSSQLPTQEVGYVRVLKEVEQLFLELLFARSDFCDVGI